MEHQQTQIRYYAHTKDGCTEEEWELLEDHLNKVANLAAEFSEAFTSNEWAYLAGLWHDLGKYHPRFQARLRDDTIRQQHAGAGAAHAVERDPKLGRFLAWMIAGHHAGLANFKQSGDGFPKPLGERLNDAKVSELQGALPSVPSDIASRSIPHLPPWIASVVSNNEDRTLFFEFWTRFLFSALVDADRLATEAFSDPEKSANRVAAYAPISDLRARLETHLAEMMTRLGPMNAERLVNQVRRSISEACLHAAELTPGLFSLTVPTGGGKTLAAMRFALAHAEQHSMERVIVVIPYTSIIEQNAKRYAGIFGAENVLEHHSNIDPEKRRETLGTEITTQQELAAENWDAPIVITTTVQFFESLFSNRPSRCRKLHNVARSVIILDEVQSLPAGYLLTILDGLKQLATLYGCSIVLSTATPPALCKRESLPAGLDGVREIIDDPSALAVDLRRVQYEWPPENTGPREWPELAAELATHRQVLVVTHRRQDARELAKELARLVPENEPVFHLSALMCPAHRLDVLERVREALDQGAACRLISTQLIEAGVDVDFPVVYRALGGLDSVVQAAGRCNREGKLESGRVVVFRAQSQPPPGILRQGLEVANIMLLENPDLDADNPQTQELYFRRLYFGQALDIKNIQRERREMNFATVGHDFRLIEDGFAHPIIIPWCDGAERLARLKHALDSGFPVGRNLFRALQPYTVSIYDKSFNVVQASGALEEVCEGLYALSETHRSRYDETFGLVIGDEPIAADPEQLVI